MKLSAVPTPRLRHEGSSVMTSTWSTSALCRHEPPLPVNKPLPYYGILKHIRSALLLSLSSPANRSILGYLCTSPREQSYSHVCTTKKQQNTLSYYLGRGFYLYLHCGSAARLESVAETMENRGATDSHPHRWEALKRTPSYALKFFDGGACETRVIIFTLVVSMMKFGQ